MTGNRRMMSWFLSRALCNYDDLHVTRACDHVIDLGLVRCHHTRARSRVAV